MSHVPNMRGMVFAWIGPLCYCLLAAARRSIVDEALARDAKHKLAAVAARLEVCVPRKRPRAEGLASVAHIASFCRTIHRMVRHIDHAWAQLAEDALYYPGLNEVSEFTCAWRGHGKDTLGVAGWLRTVADIPVDAGWLGWPEAGMYLEDGLSDDFLEAWRQLNPENLAVRQATALLQEGWYEVRLYPHEWDLDRQPILVISWAIHGIIGAFVAEAAWVDPAGRYF